MGTKTESNVGKIVVVIILWLIYLILGAVAMITHQTDETIGFVLVGGGLVCAFLTVLLFVGADGFKKIFN